MDLLANAMVSFACAMQVQAFRKVNGHAFASTMCIGNLRSGMESLCAYGKTKDKKILRKSGNYFGIIFLFAVGAALGGHMIGYIRGEDHLDLLHHITDQLPVYVH